MKRDHLLLCLTLLLSSFAGIQLRSQTMLLKPDSVIEKELTSGETHEYSISLKKDQLCFVELMQDGIDLIITAFDEKKEKIADFDSPNGQYGPEPINLVSKVTGTYSLEVKALDEAGHKGQYTIRLLKVEAVAKSPEGKVDQLFSIWDRPDSPGAAVAIVKKGKLIYSKGYGSANLEYDIPNQPATVFHIASVSKQFTAFAVALLADQGKLDLDADIRTYLPEVPDLGEKITLRHLAHHTSGMRDQWNLLAMAGWRLDDVITKEQVLKLVSLQRDLNFKPGEEYVYCNTGFTLMAEAVARVSGQSFAAWTEEHIFKPLGMSNTLFYDDHERIVKNRAYSYYQDKTGFKKSVLSYANVGATSLFTTVEDLAKWAVNFDKMTVGNEAVMAQMHRKGILNSGREIDYAFGQGIGDYKGLKIVSHGGADAGYRTFLVRFPEQDLSVIVFSNLASFNPGGIAFKIADIYLAGQLKESPVEDKPASPLAGASNVVVSEAVLESYIGQYEIAPGFILTISREGDKLQAQATAQPKLTLTTVSENEFYAESAQATLIFEKEGSGNGIQAILKQGGQEIKMKRLPDFDPKKTDLAVYTGNFYSPELETTYHLLVEEGKLIARHQRHPDIELTPAKVDVFTGNTWFFQQISFTRDGSNAVNGCKVSSGRVRGLWFEKKVD